MGLPRKGAHDVRRKATETRLPPQTSTAPAHGVRQSKDAS
ncbi:MAG TPA: hypothetical protein DEF41_03190 [Desulfovibrio sp.]|uniref:Uncharacterized protein n=1 Tax=Nitratidesulfovibrio vulgaris (strain ATCC 29579 / DSM 644 / CCUG 34227 / NCIMB 8303 / VKM B-1760 / Hildenborough) TaxID=882 RepID=Q726F5_NITV2|nr:hypothetical protein DVU_3153 [Nitratidesulfovibrio vulgaris str. Hildenborough]HBW15154.1 hypothetical protein [Desulfovibrio sp.]